MPDHVHMMLSIPPKYAVSQVVGYIKGKSAIHIARTFLERKRNFMGSTSGQGILQEAGGRGRAPRTIEHVALRPPLSVPKHRGCVSDPTAAMGISPA